MTDTLVLTGPIGVGKCTREHPLAHRLGRPLCVYDEILGLLAGRETRWRGDRHTDLPAGPHSHRE